jgi:hypothetical protein
MIPFTDFGLELFSVTSHLSWFSFFAVGFFFCGKSEARTSDLWLFTDFRLKLFSVIFYYCRRLVFCLICRLLSVICHVGLTDFRLEPFSVECISHRVRRVNGAFVDVARF